MVLDSESVYQSFASWIISEKRRRRPESLFVVGVNGTVGQGKSVFSRAIVSQLNALLLPAEGRAITRSLDDYYLSKAERYRPEFLARGYNPQGIPNRGPAGTHDTARLWSDLQTLEKSAPDSIIALPVFDKQADDRSADVFQVRGRVGVFILEGWFVGAKTDADSSLAPPGLKRSVAAALKEYAPVFNRLDALWAFDPLKSVKAIAAQRLEQQQTLDRETGKTGMTPEQILLFVNYFYRQSWQEDLTSPFPPREKTSFLAFTNAAHQFIKVEANA